MRNEDYNEAHAPSNAGVNTPVVDPAFGSAPPAATPPGASPGDPFDPKRLRLGQDFAASAGVKRQLVTVPVRRPDRQWFVRVHPSTEYRLETAVLEDRDERQTYLVEPALWNVLPAELSPRMLFTAITRQNVLFIWPVALPDASGRQNPWAQSALEAAQMAMGSWVRMSANMALQAYDIWTASAEIPEPAWPEVPFKTILEIAFRNNFIRDVDHPVIKKLRGAA